jgi:hypothetical protein
MSTVTIITNRQTFTASVNIIVLKKFRHFGSQANLKVIEKPCNLYSKHLASLRFTWQLADKGVVTQCGQ